MNLELQLVCIYKCSEGLDSRGVWTAKQSLLFHPVAFACFCPFLHHTVSIFYVIIQTFLEISVPLQSSHLKIITPSGGLVLVVWVISAAKAIEASIPRRREFHIRHVWIGSGGRLFLWSTKYVLPLSVVQASTCSDRIASHSWGEEVFGSAGGAEVDVASDLEDMLSLKR